MNNKLILDITHQLNSLLDDGGTMSVEQLLPISKQKTKCYRRLRLETLLNEAMHSEKINESPVTHHDVSYSMRYSDWLYNTIEAAEYIKGIKGKLVGKIDHYGEILVYEYKYIHPTDSNLIEYLLIAEKQKIIIGAIILVESKNAAGKDIVITNGLWNDQHSGKGSIYKFFTTWLLPNHKLIISDNRMTTLGEKFWLKIIEYGLTNNKECGIFITTEPHINKKEEIIPLTNIKDFGSAWDELGCIKHIYIKE